MTGELEVPVFKKPATAEQMRDYFEWHVQNGRGRYAVELRGFYWVMPPTNDTHDDAEEKVFTRGFQ